MVFWRSLGFIKLYETIVTMCSTDDEDSIKTDLLTNSEQQENNSHGVLVHRQKPTKNRKQAVT